MTELDLVADTGCSVGVILRPYLFHALRYGTVPDIESNFGKLVGGWLRIYLPAWGIVELVRGYGNDKAVSDVKLDHPDFVGLVGLPILRLGEYGGNADAFWFRYPPS